MSLRTANCPNCGAPVEFRWSGAVQTTCSFCHSIIVRTDIDVRAVGKVADLPPETSPIMIGTSGVYSGKSFVVTGRILYEYELGGWNEWHIVIDGGASAWLADAQLEYDISVLTQAPFAFPPPEQIQRGQAFHMGNHDYQVTSITRAHYRGVEGELPFQYWDKSDVIFADLRTTTGDFGTIDYSENPPLLFTGRAVPFDDLHLKNLRIFEGWTAA